MIDRNRGSTWEIPWTDKPGRLPSMGSQRVGHDWATEQQLNTHTEIFKYSENLWDFYLNPLYLFSRT